MKQLHLQGVTPFAEAPIDASEDVVTDCGNSEARAVRFCLDFAFEMYGVNQKTVAKLCGWGGKSSNSKGSFLSEIANPENPKTMPAKAIRKFTLATGCRLVEQFHERQELLRKLAGKQTTRDRSRAAVSHLVATARATTGADRRAMERAA